jgi:hypothetical protein
MRQLGNFLAQSKRSDVRFGVKLGSRPALPDSVLPSTADVVGPPRHVRKVPEADMGINLTRRSLRGAVRRKVGSCS